MALIGGNMNDYQCCFCGEKVVSNEIDVCSLGLTTNWDKTEDVQGEQQFFCHAECLRKRIHDSVPLIF